MKQERKVRKPSKPFIPFDHRVPDRRHYDRKVILLAGLLVAVVVGTYWKVTENDFVNYDDNDYVTENPHVQSGLTTEGIVWAFTTGHTANWHPVTWISHMVDVELFGLNPGKHHLASLLWHAVNTVLLFSVLRLITRGLWQSAFVAIMFGVHPIHVESVAWIAERKDLLSAFFGLLTIRAYLGYVRGPSFKTYGLVVLPFSLGLMSKPMLVTLPFVLLLLDYWPLGRMTDVAGPTAQSGVRTSMPRGFFLRSRFTQLLLEKAPLLVLSAVSSAVTFVVQQRIGAVSAIDQLSLQSRLANAVVSYVDYLRKLVWPSDLAVFYPHLAGGLPEWRVLVSAILLGAISFLVIRETQRHPYLPVGWFWFLGTLVPVIGLVQVGSQAMADRYAYIPFIGLYVIIAWSFAHLAQRWRKYRAGIAAGAGFIMCVLIVLTTSQLNHWHNSIALFEHSLRVTTPNWVAHTNLATALKRQQRISEAMTHFEEAAKIQPNSPEAHYNLGAALFEAGMVKASIPHYLRALELRPDNWETHYNIALAYSNEGLSSEALSHFSKSLRLNPDSPETEFHIGTIYHTTGNLDFAIRHYQAAIALRPGFAEAHSNLGTAFHLQGRIGNAIEEYRRALQLKPDMVEPRRNLERALAGQGQPREVR